MTTTFKIQLVNMNTGSVAGHKAGCSDLKKLAVRHDVLSPYEYSSKRDAWEDYNMDFLAEGSGAWDIDWKNCTSHIPADHIVEVPQTDGESTEAPRTVHIHDIMDEVAKDLLTTATLTRKECLAHLAAAGYTGPTSYLMPQLRAIVSKELGR